jgi:hypothetical protein
MLAYNAEIEGSILKCDSATPLARGYCFAVSRVVKKYLFVEHIHMNMIQSKDLYDATFEHTSIIT